MDVWVHRCMDVWVHRCVDVWVSGYGCVGVWVWIHGCMDVEMCGCMDQGCKLHVTHLVTSH